MTEVMSATVGATDQVQAEVLALKQQLMALVNLQASGTAHLDAAISDIKEKLVLLGFPSEGTAEKAANPTPPVVATSRACNHNTWDNVRTKKGQVFLRCRICDSQWRTPVETLDRCPLFNTPAGCSHDPCPQLHLHARKQSLSERVALHGNTVLERVPPGSHEEEEQQTNLAASDQTAQQQQQQLDENSNTVATIKPCDHNSWDNVRTKKGQVFLRCRDCEAQWRTPVDNLERCVQFNSGSGCPNGTKCPMLHLHTRKQSLAERLAKHGTTILGNTPADATTPTAQQPIPYPSNTSINSQPGAGIVPSTVGLAPESLPYDTTLIVSKQHGTSIGMTVKGNVVTKVEPNTPGAISGLQEGMKIIGVNAIPVGNSTKEVVTTVRDVWNANSEMRLLVRVQRTATQQQQQQQQPAPIIMPGAAAVQQPAPQNHFPYYPPVNDMSVLAQHQAQIEETQSNGSRMSYPSMDVVIPIQKKFPNEPLGITVKSNIVTKVTIGSPAGIAGVLEGMALHTVNGIQVRGTTTDVVALIREAWQCGSVINLVGRTPGSTAPPPLDTTFSDVGSVPPSEGNLSRPETPSTMTHSPYANGNEMPPPTNPPTSTSLNPSSLVEDLSNHSLSESCCPPLLTNLSSQGKLSAGHSSDVVSTTNTANTSTVEVEMHITIRKQHPQDSFGASVKGNTVSKVAAGSAAAAAGITEGMTILSVNGKPVGKTTIGVVTAVRGAWKAAGVMEVLVASSVKGEGVSEGEIMSISEGGSRYDISHDGSISACSQSVQAPATITTAGVEMLCPAVRLDSSSSARGWSDRAYDIFYIPQSLHDGILLQTPHKSIPAGTQLVITVHCDAMLYLFHSNALGRDGGFPASLAQEEWIRDDESPSWSGSPVAALGLSLWKKAVTSGEIVSLPATTTTQTTMGIIVSKMEDDISLNNLSFNTISTDHRSFGSRAATPTGDESSNKPTRPHKTRQRSSTLTSIDASFCREALDRD
eukprot:TRINITY_DN3742_c0_g1_i1.p1 TRINITY_DN3742_c0_g1~~TRINITY_DN3742_c0_g1_i1.p1  ORF type:complete len:983 (+),score=213.16 TRINITY_DN3742_c0_g1_i1:131-3079(+)